MENRHDDEWLDKVEAWHKACGMPLPETFPKRERMEIAVRVDKVYGNVVLYPVCDKAKLFAKLAGTKTLTSETIGVITALGYKVMQERLSLPA